MFLLLARGGAFLKTACGSATPRKRLLVDRINSDNCIIKADHLNSKCLGIIHDQDHRLPPAAPTVSPSLS